MKKLLLFVFAMTLFACRSEFEDYDTEDQLEIDIERIDAYLRANDVDAQAAPSGIRYVITKEGDGVYPTEGQVVSVDYELWKFSGELVDTSKEDLAIEEGIYTAQREYVPLQFTLGDASYIPGFQLSVLLLDEKGEGDFFIPSTLAYRHVGTATITPNENIYFKIRLVDIAR